MTLIAVTTPGMSPAAALQEAIAASTRKGWRLQAATPTTASMVYEGEKPINHPLHVFLIAVTCGLWFVVWLIMMLTRYATPKYALLILVDEQGNVTYQQSQ